MEIVRLSNWPGAPNASRGVTSGLMSDVADSALSLSLPQVGKTDAIPRTSSYGRESLLDLIKRAVTVLAVSLLAPMMRFV